MKFVKIKTNLKVFREEGGMCGLLSHFLELLLRLLKRRLTFRLIGLKEFDLLHERLDYVSSFMQLT